MKEYLLCVIGVVLLSALITMFLPEGKTSSTIKGVAKMLCLLCILSPIPQMLKGLQGNTNSPEKDTEGDLETFVIDTDESFIKYYSQMRIQNAERLLEGEILEDYGVSCLVKITWEFNEEIYDTDSIKIQSVQISCENATEETAMRIKQDLKERYLLEVQIE